MDFGLTGLGRALGEPAEVSAVAAQYTSDAERVLEYGYRTIHRAKPEVGLVDLASEAATAALADAGVAADELDLVVLAITDIPEYLYWDPATELQARIGAHDAEALLVAQGCIGGITSLDSVAGRFATHPEYRRALVVGANRTVEEYANRMETNTLVFSDGAAAAVLERGHPRLRWRATEVISDGRYAGFFRLDAGGAARPFKAGDKPGEVRNVWDVMDFFEYDPDRFEAFINLTHERVNDVVARACKRIGRPAGDLARIVLLNDNVKTLAAQAERLGVAPADTNAGIARDFGHLGAADYLFNLHYYRATEALHPGDLVALAGMGRGLHWACTILEC